MRVRYGPIIIPNQLKMGKWMMLEGGDLDALYEEVGLKVQRPEPTGRAQREKKMRPLKNQKPKRSNKPEADRSTKGPRLRGRGR
jgi:23S rRNA pseudouridine2605 synthase